MTPIFSVIVPVYNRPEEVAELLDSLTKQSFKEFEVIIVEDGSAIDCKEICDGYQNELELYYYAVTNGGPGLARNIGFRKAKTDFFIVFDSDCLIPSTYMASLRDAMKRRFDAFGGPDAAHHGFGMVQKAVSYAMTSFLTTGGIRGKGSSVEKFKPRSFNMGLSREVFEKTGGFSSMRYGEDIDFSIRMEKEGFKTVLIEECYVYHKRRTNLIDFYHQVKESGKARIDLNERHPGSLKVVHLFPSVYSVGLLLLIATSFITLNWMFMIPLLLYWLLIFTESLVTTLNPLTALLAILTSNLMLLGYGYGLIKNWFFKA